LQAKYHPCFLKKVEKTCSPSAFPNKEGSSSSSRYILLSNQVPIQFSGKLKISQPKKFVISPKNSPKFLEIQQKIQTIPKFKKNTLGRLCIQTMLMIVSFHWKDLLGLVLK
jgi:hypothetical protein